MLQVLEDQRQFPVEIPKITVSDNGSRFTAKALQDYVTTHEITLETVVTSALMSIKKAEQMIGTIKRGVSRMMSTGKTEWDAGVQKGV